LKAESISAQKEHPGPSRLQWPKSLQQEYIYDYAKIKKSIIKVSLSIKEVQDQDLGSWKVSEVIAQYSRRTLVDGNLNVWLSLSETESVRLRRVHPKLSQFDSVASKSALSQDRVRFVFAETKSNQSLPRASEDPHKHLKEFHVFCSTMRPQGIPEDYIKMKAFPFSLDRATKDWLYLHLVMFNTWRDMKHMFLEKFFLASKIATIWKEICGIRQHSGETLHEH
ncbi:hypothetical protein CR513_26922, partial [Mucuna pruriens]